MAVLPTPGSPISTGLFFLRRDRISITRSISSARPMVGSSSPWRASSVRSRQKWSSAGVLLFFSPLAPAAPPALAVGALADGAALGSLPSSLSVSRRASSSVTPSWPSTSAAIPFSSRSRPSSRCSVPT